MSGHIVAIGGGSFEETAPIREYILGLARSDRPRVCFVPTATGDDPFAIARFYRAFSELDCSPTDLTLFDRTVLDLPAFIREQDVIYVGGGNTASLLGVWRAHGLFDLLRSALADGAVLCGSSAGMNCWFQASTTDSFGSERLAPLHDGLGLITGSACPHYDAEEQRRPLYRQLIADGFPAGYAADNRAALHFTEGDLVTAVSCSPDARAYYVELVDGEVQEHALETRQLGAPPRRLSRSER